MSKHKIFEIPIYSMSQDEYEKRCFNHIDKESLKTNKANYDFYHNYLIDKIFRNRPWLYNQIIGYITVCYSDHSLYFEKYITFDKKIHAIGNAKHFIYNVGSCGTHFYVNDNMNNNEIIVEIKKWIDNIDKDLNKNKYYLDKTIITNTIDYTDIRKLINEIEYNNENN